MIDRTEYRGTGILPACRPSWHGQPARVPHGRDGRATRQPVGQASLPASARDTIRACVASLALLAAGCAAAPTEPAPAEALSETAETAAPLRQAATVAPEAIDALRTGTLRIGAEPLGPVPNSGLLLPAVSPDGRWIAALRAGEEADVYPDDLFTGRGLGPVELVIAPAADPAERRVIVPRGAAWPAWSADGRRLVAVTYGEDGQARIAVHDRRTGETQTLAPGFRRIIAPRFSPDGRRIAFAAHGADASGSRIYILDLETRATRPAPAPPPGADLLFPLWVDGRTLLCFLVDGAAADQGKGTDAGGGTADLPASLSHRATSASPVTVRRWRIGEPRMREIATLRLDPPSADALFQSLASVADPLSPDRRRLLYYSPDDDRLVALDLATGEDRPLAAESFAACWLSPDLLAVATGNDLLLAFPADRSPPRQLTHGRTIPRWADPRRGHILFLTPGDSPWSFQLIRLHFSTAG